MRTSSIIVTLVAIVLLTADVASAASQCTCGEPQGTMYRTCPRHGDDCAGAGPHQHENQKGGRSLAAPLFCKVNTEQPQLFQFLGVVTQITPEGVVVLPGYTCKQVKKGLADLRKQVRKTERAEKSRNKALEKAVTNNFFTRTIKNRVNHNKNRIISDVRRDVRKDLNNWVDSWFGR